MKVLQFAFSSDLKNPFLPRNYNSNCVCYTGTHDNDTSLGWYNTATEKEKLIFSKFVMNNKHTSVPLSLIAYGMKSKAKTIIIPIQDYLELPSSERINTPGTEIGNWEWRIDKASIDDELIKTIKYLSNLRK